MGEFFCGHEVYLNHGYKTVYLPWYPLADANGEVYIHRIRAQEMLGRPLKEGERVHHINHDKADNRYENLMVFRTNRDHTLFHHGYEAVIDKNTGAYYVPNAPEYVCEKCGKPIDRKATLCLDCYRKQHSARIPEKGKLEELVKENSFESIGRMYGVTGKAVRKWCDKYGLEIKRYHVGKKISKN